MVKNKETPKTKILYKISNDKLIPFAFHLGTDNVTSINIHFILLAVNS